MKKCGIYTFSLLIFMALNFGLTGCAEHSISDFVVIKVNGKGIRQGIHLDNQEEVIKEIKYFYNNESRRYAGRYIITKVLKYKIEIDRKFDLVSVHVLYDYRNIEKRKKKKYVGPWRITFRLIKTDGLWKIEKQVATCVNCLINVPLIQ